MSTDTFGNTGAALRGTPVPTTSSADPNANKNFAMQTPGTMGVAPTLNANFQQPPQGGMQAPAVVTSQEAEDHVSTMGGASDQATKDAQTMAAYNASIKAAANSTQTDTGTDQTKTGTAAADSASVDSILSSLGLDITGLDDQQKSVLAEDQAQIMTDQQTQEELDKTLTALETGSFPLTPSEQNQVNAVRASSASSLLAAQNYAKNVQAGATVLTAKTGMQMYSPQIALGTIKNAITAGQAKVEEVNSTIASNMSKLTTALQNQDYQQATRLYTKIGEDIATRTKEIDAINKTVSDTSQTLLKANIDAQAAYTKSINDLLTSAGKAGAPPEVIQAIGAAPDIASAIQAAGKYLQPTTTTGLLGEYALYQAQAKALGQVPLPFLDTSGGDDFVKRMANLKTPVAKTPTTTALDTVGATGTKADGTPVTQADTTSWLSDFYGAGGNVTLPSLGIGNLAAGVKVGILNGIANHALTLGIKGSQFAAILASKQGAKQAINTVSRNQGMMTVAESTANGNFDQVLSQMGTLPVKTINPALNDAIQWFSVNTGNPNVQGFSGLLMTALNEYAKVITGQTSGAAVSDAARKEAQSMITAGSTPDAIRNFVATAKQEMGNRIAGYDDAKNQFYSLISSVYGDVTPPADAADQGDPSGAIASEAQAQAQVDHASTGNPDLQKTVYTMLSQPDATLGRPLTYSEVLQVLQATGQIK